MHAPNYLRKRKEKSNYSKKEQMKKRMSFSYPKMFFPLINFCRNQSERKKDNLFTLSAAVNHQFPSQKSSSNGN